MSNPKTSPKTSHDIPELDEYQPQTHHIWTPGPRPVIVVRTAKYGRAKYKADMPGGRLGALKHYAEERALQVVEEGSGEPKLIDTHPLTGVKSELNYQVEVPGQSKVIV